MADSHSRRLITSNSDFENLFCYSRAIRSGDWLHVSGTTGYNYDDNALADTVEEQCAQALTNIEKSLDQGGATWNDVVKVTYLLPDRRDWAKCVPLVRTVFKDARPAATLMQVGLMEERMLIEIEVTAHIIR